MYARLRAGLLADAKTAVDLYLATNRILSLIALSAQLVAMRARLYMAVLTAKILVASLTCQKLSVKAPRESEREALRRIGADAAKQPKNPNGLLLKHF